MEEVRICIYDRLAEGADRAEEGGKIPRELQRVGGEAGLQDGGFEDLFSVGAQHVVEVSPALEGARAEGFIARAVESLQHQEQDALAARDLARVGIVEDARARRH